ncbi:uncharacterized protein BP01DRAFT_402582 [Aspergillus saccharolyticus JOP 1030-1]|uniref:Uncharacterized protein n=1 Tax=Aspergillus saccharolyticus JOP 1030-1 TaxID=1450539 RepID=A0A318ZFU9_9EURO|nr:hypothetical protein BP01DRAFT_402582 [Aspergillus saccharolyticus JOP 1030-1]PYH43493.1 hypothetical protein BP01DRAFT_402582 [Aspergillus saccharolyticus JOP 1030-1]
MPANKDRLYIALFARGGKATMPGKEDTHHWAILIGSKAATNAGSSVQYHAKERISQEGKSEFFFEEHDASAQMLLILRGIPVSQNVSGWNCVSWVKEALEVVDADTQALASTRVCDWGRVRDAAIEYCQRKKDQHRFDGKGDYDMGVIPTYDLMVGRGLIF